MAQIDIPFYEVVPLKIPPRIRTAFSGAFGIGRTRVSTRVFNLTGSWSVILSLPRRTIIGRVVAAVPA
jgi:hypothetical protein